MLCTIDVAVTSDDCLHGPSRAMRKEATNATYIRSRNAAWKESRRGHKACLTEAGVSPCLPFGAEGGKQGWWVAIPAFFLSHSALKGRQAVREPLRSAHVRYHAMRAVFIRTKYECKVVDLDRTSLVGAIGNHGGYVRLDYGMNAQTAAAVHESCMTGAVVSQSADQS